MLIFVFISIAIASQLCAWVEIEKCRQRIDPNEVCNEKAIESKEELPNFVKSSVEKWSIVHYQNGYSFHHLVSSFFLNRLSSIESIESEK